MGKGLAERRKSHSNVDEAASEWETVAATEELYEQCQEMEERQTRRKRNIEFGSGAYGTLNPTTASSSVACRKNTILGPPDISLPKLPTGVPRQHLTTYPSFYSSSSFYSDLDTDGEMIEKQLLHPDAWVPVPSHSRMRPVTMWFGGNLRGDQWMGRRISKTSSTTSGDPFQYDGRVYSTFLQPAAECEINNAPHRATINYHSYFDLAGPGKIEKVGQNGINSCTRNSFYNPAAIQSA